MRVIRNNSIVEDGWSVVLDDLVPPEGDVIVELSVWNAQHEQLSKRSGRVGVKLSSHELPEQIEELESVPLVAIDFPKYVDGRGYSLARLLRSRFGFKGELRAIGEVLHDQLFFMFRCGIDSYALKEGKDMQGALAALRDFSVTYQAGADDERALFRRVDR